MTREERKEKRQLKKMLIIYNEEFDIRYRAPFGILSMKLIAWLCMILTQVAVVCRLAGRYMGGAQFDTMDKVFTALGELAVPCFLFATFSYILSNREKCLRILVIYAAGAAGIAGLFYLFFFHYGAGILEKLLGITFDESVSSISQLFIQFNPHLKSINAFMDLFLCTLFVYFLLGKPPKYMEKCRIIFRLCALIPVLYVVAVFVLKVGYLFFGQPFPLVLYPIMPTKAFATYLAFLIIALIQLREKHRYMKQGGTPLGYSAYIKTKRSSLTFAKSSAKVYAVIGVLDILVIFLSGILFAGATPTFLTRLVECFGIGQCAGFLIFAPLILLFAYNRNYKNVLVPILLPAISMAIIILLYAETGYMALMMF